MKRQYDQLCPLASALDIVGERWAMLVVRELLLGPRRFMDLEAGLPGIGTNTLATRLDELERAGVIGRRRLPAPSAAAVYELTAWGRELEPIVHSIARWGAPLLATATPRHPLRASWLAVALGAFFRPDVFRDRDAVVELVLPTGTLAMRIAKGELRITDGEAGTPALRVFTSEQNFLEMLTGSPGFAPQALRVEGDATLLPRLVEAFPLALDAAG